MTLFNCALDLCLMTFVERMRYFVPTKFEQEAEALLENLCRMRARLGLQTGRLWRRSPLVDGGPALTWECEFPDRHSLTDDVAIRGESAELDEINRRLRELAERMEREVSEGQSTLHNGLMADFADLELVPSEVSFESAGRSLKGYLYLPPTRPPYSAIIFNHGSGLEKGTDEPVYPGVAAVLLSWGLAVLLPHRHGYGNSPGPGWRDDCPDPEFSDAYNAQLLGRLDRESDDVVAAFRYLSKRPEIRADRIGMMGTSLGGINSLFSSVKEPRIRCAVNFAGAAMNWERNQPLVSAMFDAACKATQPVLYVQAANDYSIGPTKELPGAASVAGRIAEAKIFPSFGMTPMEGHRFSTRGPHIWGNEVRRFLARWL